MENDVAQQSADMPHSDQDSKAQRSDESFCESRLELTRMDQSVATESNQPMYPPPGLDDPNHETEHPTAPTTTIASHQNISRRPTPGRRRALSQTSTAGPLPLEDVSCRSLDLDTVSEGTDETGFSENKRPRTSKFPSRHHQKEKCWDILTPPRRCQVFQVKSQMLQSSLSTATECWILERRISRGFIPNPSSRENALIHQKSVMQAFW